MRFIALLMIAIISFAIDIELKPDNNISVEYKDAQILKDYLYQTYRYRITDKGAYSIVKENRLLANAYLKKNLLSQKDKDYLAILAEKYLAEKFIKEFQKKQKLTDKILLSYYLDHQDEFKKEDKIHFILLQFPSFNKVMQFYHLTETMPHKQAIERAKSDYNATVRDLGWKEFSKLKTTVKSFVKKGKKDYFLPPFIFAPQKVDILYVADYRVGKGYKKFEEIKEEIKKILYSTAFVKERKRLLQQVENND